MPSHNQGYPITIDGVASSTIPEFICNSIKRQLVGARRHTLEEVPGLEGAWLFPEEPGLKEITLECDLLADSFPTGRRAAARAIAAWAEKFTWVKMICGDDPDWFNWVILNDGSDLDEWRHLAEFDLVFLAAPYAISNSISTHNEVSATASKTFNVNVGGSVKTYPVIEFDPATSVSGVTITINGRTIEYTPSAPFNTNRTFNSIAKITEIGANTDVNIEGDWSGANLSMGPMVQIQYPSFLPGVNSVQIETPSGGWEVDISWRNRA